MQNAAARCRPTQPRRNLNRLGLIATCPNDWPPTSCESASGPQRYGLPTGTRPALPRSRTTGRLGVPSDHRLRFDDDERRSPAGPRCGTAYQPTARPSRAATAEAAFAAAPAVCAATPAPRAGARRANAPILVGSGGATGARQKRIRARKVRRRAPVSCAAYAWRSYLEVLHQHDIAVSLILLDVQNRSPVGRNGQPGLNMAAPLVRGWRHA